MIRVEPCEPDWLQETVGVMMGRPDCVHVCVHVREILYIVHMVCVCVCVVCVHACVYECVCMCMCLHAWGCVCMCVSMESTVKAWERGSTHTWTR